MHKTCAFLEKIAFLEKCAIMWTIREKKYKNHQNTTTAQNAKMASNSQQLYGILRKMAISKKFENSKNNAKKPTKMSKMRKIG